MKPQTIVDYNEAQTDDDRLVCDTLRSEIEKGLTEAESKIWHAHPVWVLRDNPIVGYSKLKGCVRLLFWSGQSFSTPGLQREGKFMAAEKRFGSVSEIDLNMLQRWLDDARRIQWDYKNIVRRKGRLEPLGEFPEGRKPSA
ncbi:MAG: DUF1801 domain-containing protein [Rhodothalassiaceae bacterium]